jgi:hypothetical protein
MLGRVAVVQLQQGALEPVFEVAQLVGQQRARPLCQAVEKLVDTEGVGDLQTSYTAGGLGGPLLAAAGHHDGADH